MQIELGQQASRRRWDAVIRSGGLWQRTTANRLTVSALVLIGFGCGLSALAWGPPTVEAADPRVLAADEARVRVMSEAAKSVVAIFAPGGEGGGSGVLVSADGFAVSNFHVTSGCGDFMKCGLNDGELYDAVIVGLDPTGDVALIKLFGREDFPAAKLGDSDQVQTGDWVFAMGNPFLLATDFQPTVTYGVVSGTRRYQYPAGTILEYTDCIQTDASINPGNSGGPLFNARGELIGINGRGSFEKRGRVNSGAGYAISINQVKHFIDHLRSGRIVDHGTLGALVSGRDDGAVVVDTILEESSAFRRGLREGDELVSFGGRAIGSVNQFKNILGIYPKGWLVPLVYRRDGAEQRIDARLRGLHRESELLPKEMDGQPPGRPRPGQKPGENPLPPGQEPKPGEEPKRGEQPQPGPGEPDDHEHPIPGGPNPHGRGKTVPPPPHLAKFFVKKRGFANYFFNQQEQDRVFAGLSRQGDLSGLSGAWKLNGRLQGGQFAKPVDFVLSLKPAGVAMEIASEKQLYGQFLDGKAAFEDEPNNTGGLLLSWHLWKLLLTQGRRGFDECFYLGSEPLDGRGERVDIVTTRWQGAETNWLFSRASGELVGWDTYRTLDVDPCEIRLVPGKPLKVNAITLPAAGSVRYAGQEYGTFEFGSATLGESKPMTALRN